MAKKIKYAFDGIHQVSKRYVRRWKDGREWVVQIWAGDKPEGDPKDDWAMPGVLGSFVAMEQEVAQSR